MKFARKLVTLAIVLAMVMAFMVPTAMAVTPDTGTGTIKVENVLAGETYTAYKILNYTSSGDAYSYYLTKAEYDNGLGAELVEAGFAFALSADGTQYAVTNTEALKTAGADNMVAKLKNADLSKAIAKSEVVANANGQAVFSNLGDGYYYVTSSLGSLCALSSYDNEVLIVEKNSVPSIDKTQSKDGTTYADDLVELSMGDTVYYQIEVTNGKGTNQNIVLTDVLSDGLTLDEDSITVNVDAGNYEVSNITAQGFTLTLKDTYVATLDEGAKVIIKYTAVVNEKAAIDAVKGNSNTVTMDYSKQLSSDVVYVATYDFAVNKTDEEGNPLTGAKFNLYDAATGGNQIYLAADVKEGNTTCYYVSANGNAVIEAGTGINVRGLEPGDYFLEEIEAPAGYNKLPNRVKFTIVADATTPVAVTVQNQAGVVLPSTGGIGTTIFYVLGGVLFLGALVILFTNKRMRQN